MLSFLFYAEAVVRRCSVKNVLLKILQNSQGNNYARVLFLKKLQALACNFIKKRLQHSCFPVNFATFLKTSFCKTPLVAASVYVDYGDYCCGFISKEKILKELRNYKWKLFLCPPQKQARTQPTFQNYCFSQYIYTSSHQTKHLHIENWICLSQVVFFAFLPLEMQNRLKQT